MDEMFLSCLPCCSFIQGSSHFPHVRVSVHVLTSRGLISFNSLIFLVHSLVSSVYIFLMLNSGSWSLHDLLGQDFGLACFKLILQHLLIRPYQLSIPDIQPNIMLSKPSSADNHFMLSKIKNQEGLVQELLSSHNQMEFDGVCDLWSV